jgi:hypothetical protein
MSIVERHDTAPLHAGVWWRGEKADRASLITGYAILVLTWIRDRKVAERLADVEIPHGMLIPTLLAAWVGQRRRNRAWAALTRSMVEVANALTARMRQSDERSKQLLELQASIERLAREGDVRDRHLLDLQASIEGLTRWLVRLTIILGVIGLGGIGATLWAALK